MVDRARSRPRTDVKKYANVRVENRAKGVEEPAMRVDLFLVLLLEAEYDLHRYDPFLCALDLVRLGDGDCREKKIKIRRP